MQKVNFVIAFFVAFFSGCVVTETGTNCSCQASPSQDPIISNPDPISVSPDFLSDAGLEDLATSDMPCDADWVSDSSATVLQLLSGDR